MRVRRQADVSKLGATALAALAFDGLPAKSVRANDHRYLDLPMAPQSGAVDLGAGDTGIKNDAYALEQDELAFLKKGLASPFGGITADERRIFQKLPDQEVVHNEFFKAMLGTAIPALQTDFSKVNFAKRDGVLKTAVTFADFATLTYNGADKIITENSRC